MLRKFAFGLKLNVKIFGFISRPFYESGSCLYYYIILAIGLQITLLYYGMHDCKVTGVANLDIIPFIILSCRSNASLIVPRCG